ncbi:hypothetical protein CF326_g9761 [Tilletia indica]|nr:hypothetical protein CF326_g9761 [Tilletia indica]
MPRQEKTPSRSYMSERDEEDENDEADVMMALEGDGPRPLSFGPSEDDEVNFDAPGNDCDPFLVHPETPDSNAGPSRTESNTQRDNRNRTPECLQKMTEKRIKTRADDKADQRKPSSS